MCQQILQFCSGSTRPLLFAGAFLSLLSAVAIGYLGCTTNALFSGIDLKLAETKSLHYHIQLATAAYLTLVTALTCYAAYYDHKYSIRALAAVTVATCILALVAILMIPTGAQTSKPFGETLEKAVKLYDFKDKPAPEPSAATRLEPEALPATGGSPTSQQQQQAANNRSARWVASDYEVREMSSENATKIWDTLQRRGCCGLTDYKQDWKDKIPKSCCSNPTNENELFVCKEADQNHQMGCMALIGSTSLNLMIVLGLIALVNFYLATISGISAYKTYSYSEASQNAYT